MRLGWAVVLAAALVLPVAAMAQEALWREGPALPAPRAEHGGAEAGGEILLAGDFFDRLEIDAFDPATGAWRVAGALPAPLHHPAVVGWDGMLYVIGGYAGDFQTGWTPLDTVLALDPATGEWHRIEPLPTPRGSPSAVVAEGRIHVLGGVDASGRNTGAHEIYDIAAGTWSSGPDLPTPRDHFAAVLADGHIFAIGGRINGRLDNLGVNEAFDLASETWQSLAPLPTPRSGIAAGLVGGRIVVVGGESSQGTFAEAEAFDLENGTWSTLPELPTPRHGLAAVAIGEALHVLGGGPEVGASRSTLHDVLTFAAP